MNVFTMEIIDDEYVVHMRMQTLGDGIGKNVLKFSLWKLLLVERSTPRSCLFFKVRHGVF